MARIIKGSSNAGTFGHKQKKPNIRRGILLLILAALSGYLYMKTDMLSFLFLALGGLTVAAIFIIPALLSSGSGDFFSVPSEEMERYGMAGEIVTGDLLENKLPDSYTVIQNARVFYKGKTSEIDNIVIGRSGIFIIEVKTMKGDVEADYDKHDWNHLKTDQYGIEHESTFYSPVKQVGTHVYRLANYLRDNGIFTHINAIVYFSSPKTHVKVSGIPNDVRIYTYSTADYMIRQIEDGDANLSRADISKAIDLLS